MNRSLRGTREEGRLKIAAPQESEERPWIEAALWSSVLLPFALLVYGGCNWINSWRANVGTMFFEWERMIPFVPVMIIPYASIFLFLAGAPFLCGNKAELHTLVKRFVVAYVASGICFLVFPLQFGFVHPPVAGLLGKTFDVLGSLDKPYNLAPSLHIVQWIIAWMVYRRHTTGILRSILKFWFVLIGISTILTYQHHIIDVMAGGVLTALCVVLYPEPQARSARPHAQTARVVPINA